MERLDRFSIKAVPFVFSVLFYLLVGGSAFADFKIEQASLSTHAFEGDKERIAFKFSEPVSENLYLEVYEFHYIMFPELAPDEDAWAHDKQMKHMEDVIAGKAEAYKPYLTDEKVKKILEVSPKETIPLTSVDKKTYYTDWKAKHGRIFFRVMTDEKYLNEYLFSMRVHCRHIDMRTFEKFKEQIQAIKLPLEHQNGSFAMKLFNDLNTTYTRGHSPRFMLQHHERETMDLERLLTQLNDSIRSSDFNHAVMLVAEIEQKIAEKENVFYTLSLDLDGFGLKLGIEDRINNYSFHEDPNVEVYVKEFTEPTIEDLMQKAHSGAMDHSNMNHAAHSNMNKPDRKELIEDAISLEKSHKNFTCNLPEKWKAISVIVLYGMDQNYYFTNQFTLE